jgi:signal transduction histidine kinase/ActR/RegA family two-component response regulator
MPTSASALESRILLYMPVGKDAQMAEKVFASTGIASFACGDFPELFDQLTLGAGAILTVEEALAAGALAPLALYVARQPTWSDIPVLVMTHQGADSIGLNEATAKLSNLTLMERPVRTATLISAVRSALRARVRQYQVREAGERKDEFLASLGHELRNPLAPIRTSMGILKRLYPDVPGVTKVREVVERQVNHLTRLVDDLLDVARITSGKVELQREPTPLSAIIAHTVEICTPLLESGQHTIEVTQPPGPVVLDVDPVRLVQSLSNILANAVKYSIKPSTIFFKAEVENQTVTFSIKDQGIGLEQDSLMRIFEMFAQNVPAPGRAPGGLGIGLSLAKQFTEMHGGSIYAKSEGPDMGSEFILTMPVVIPAEDGAAHNAAPDADDRSSAEDVRRVLVVDDNRDGADMLRMLFEADGYAAVTAYDGEEAVCTAERSPPDIVVMDIGMPGMDGYEAVRRIRNQPGGKNILMIALTGWGQESARRLATEAGFDHHLAKPVDFNVLKSFLEQAAR